MDNTRLFLTAIKILPEQQESQPHLHYYITRGIPRYSALGGHGGVFLDRRWRVIVLYEKDFLLLYYTDPVRARSLPARCRLPGEHLSLQRDTSQAISYRATFLVLYHAPRGIARSFGMISPRLSSDVFMQMHACKKILLTKPATIAPAVFRILIECGT